MIKDYCFSSKYIQTPKNVYKLFSYDLSKILITPKIGKNIEKNTSYYFGIYASIYCIQVLLDALNLKSCKSDVNRLRYANIEH